MVTNRDRKSFGLHIAEKIPEGAETKDTIDVQAFWHPLCGEFPHVQIFMMDPTCSLEMPSYSAIDLAKIRWSSKISS